MDSRTHIQSELMEMNSSLPFNVKMPVFNVPEGYFERFADGVLAKIKGKQAVTPSDELSTLSPLLAGISRKMPFSVPEDYFSEATKSLPELIQEEHLPEVFSVVGRAMPYEIPAGYFDELPYQVLDKVAKPKGKVISFNRSWMRYAAAAVLIGIVALSSIVYFSNRNNIDPTEQSESWIAKKLKNVSNQEIEEFIKTISFGNGNGTETAKKGNQESQDIEKMLKDVSDTELDAFLSQVPSGNGETLFMN
ncbi:hypothetical protein OCK74_18405 [Chitinophagaceae bacterium LB-8]|uniref:Uncharacterized protein n=1 Tax=Paraflavisolibacter caeni TaxID=2982496 RepID=A0A9X2XPE2_9BACT|nr:hypothetical protein [Paraflavisolibacter caeni]MCU7551098.1 hypothetical protein [Paraflavisolibacter caeni]